MMDNNYQYSKELLHYCLEREIRSCMPSSAATLRWTHLRLCIESREYENR